LGSNSIVPHNRFNAAVQARLVGGKLNAASLAKLHADVFGNFLSDAEIALLGNRFVEKSTQLNDEMAVNLWKILAKENAVNFEGFKDFLQNKLNLKYEDDDLMEVFAYAGIRMDAEFGIKELAKLLFI
jgi:hypothetical protein